MTREVVVSSDWHWDARTGGVARYDDAVRVAGFVVDWAIARGAAAFVFLGDLCDPDSACVHRALGDFARLLVRLKDAGIVRVVVPGNHDVVEDAVGSTIYDSLDDLALVVRGPGFFEVGDFITAYALPFAPRSRAYDPAASVAAEAREATHVLGHLNADGVVAGSESADYLRGRDVFWPTDAIAKRWPNAIKVGGHYHDAQHAPGGVEIIGAPMPLTFGEEGNVQRFLVLGENGGVRSVEIPPDLVASVRSVRTVDEARSVAPGSLVRVCSKDPEVFATAEGRGFASVVPGPVEAEPTAAAAPAATDFEAAARDAAERFAVEEERFKQAIVELVGGVLEQGRAG